MITPLLLTFALALPPAAGGVVVSAPDGDTVAVRTDAGALLLVDLAGLDCPELRHPNGEPNPWGVAAARFTREALLGKRVRVDRGFLWSGRRLHNLDLLARGLATVAGRHPSAFAAAEARARNLRRGVWSRAYPETDP